MRPPIKKERADGVAPPALKTIFNNPSAAVDLNLTCLVHSRYKKMCNVTRATIFPNIAASLECGTF
jgi:hypothetical protein